ncbi:MAG: cupin domain-containing protein [Chitinophagaceae bacterium]|nr:cupin domain-containing protein [Chitinophagaceae bacterium]
MTTNIFKPLIVGKETFHPLSYNEQEFVMKYHLEPGGGVPPHAHLYMDEYFEVLKGEMKFKVNGETVLKKAGEEIMVPKGVTHSISNAGKDQVEMTVKYMPCSDTHRFFEIVCKLSEQKPATIKTMMQGMYIADKLKLRQFSHPQPIWANQMIMSIVKFMGKLSGWDKHIGQFQR